MIERTPILNLATHAILIFGLILILVPIWLAFVGATLTLQEVNSAPIELWPGDQLFNNLREAWVLSDFGQKFVNTLIVSVGVVLGKITLACITAFALVFFNFRGRMLIFWMIFITLMLPLAVRIVPTYAVAANALSPFQAILDVAELSWLIDRLSGIEVDLQWNLLNSYTGLIRPMPPRPAGKKGRSRHVSFADGRGDWHGPGDWPGLVGRRGQAISKWGAAPGRGGRKSRAQITGAALCGVRDGCASDQGVWGSEEWWTTIRSAPASSLTKVQVLSTVVTVPSLLVRLTLPIVEAEVPSMKIAAFATSHPVQPFRAKPVSLAKAGSPPTK